jgi:hypothetical protein
LSVEVVLPEVEAALEISQEKADEPEISWESPSQKGSQASLFLAGTNIG